MVSPTEQFAADFCSLFLQSMKSLLTFADGPSLGCNVMLTWNLFFWKDGFPCDPDPSADDVVQ